MPSQSRFLLRDASPPRPCSDGLTGKKHSPAEFFTCRTPRREPAWLYPRKRHHFSADLSTAPVPLAIDVRGLRHHSMCFLAGEHGRRSPHLQVVRPRCRTGAPPGPATSPSTRPRGPRKPRIPNAAAGHLAGDVEIRRHHAVKDHGDAAIHEQVPSPPRTEPSAGHSGSQTFRADSPPPRTLVISGGATRPVLADLPQLQAWCSTRPEATHAKRGEKPGDPKGTQPAGQTYGTRIPGEADHRRRAFSEPPCRTSRD